MFGGHVGFEYRRTESGTSTQVYRLRRGRETFYVRIAETRSAALAPEAAAHAALRDAGVAVPAVVHLEPYDERLARSVLITTEVPGGPVDPGAGPAEVAAVYRAAGRDLARLHTCPVRGFGWIRRDHGAAGWPLRAEPVTYRRYVDASRTAAALRSCGFDASPGDRIEELLHEAAALGPDGPSGLLAHGDFDPTHIFADRGRYAGLIDFGEIRGTDYTFDLATMRLETAAGELPEAYRHLEVGYAEIGDLPADHERRLYLACVHSVASRLAGWYRRDGDGAARGPYFRRLRTQLMLMLGSGAPP